MVVRSFGSEVWKLTANEMLWSLGALLAARLSPGKASSKTRLR